ncbi:peptidase family M13 [Dictyocaulus viviparus]|uniref:Peptidase family M13 n=1 Tax=Dictyocaulus viviparus TaxID=29172 RepID=A0A0D8XC88_DICVI|nr:peptidase family M13 [Dictyocaulus viviparus]
MRDIFESPEILQSKSTSGLKFMYHKCMDKDELNRIGAKNLIATIRSYGVWPIIDGHKWHAEQFDLTTILINIAQIRGVTVFISHYVSLDSKNGSRSLIEFDQGQTGLARDYYLDRGKYGKKIAAYRQYLINKVKLFHEDVNIPVKEEKIASDVDEIIELETKMAKIRVPKENRRNFTKLYNLRRLSDMQKLMPLVDWFRYFHSIAPVDVHEYLAADPEILINEIDYMRRIDNLLQSTDPRIITNYVYLRYSFSWGAELGERYEDIAQEFNRQMHGQKTKAPRWKDCTKRTMRGMQYASGSLYVSKYFDKEFNRQMHGQKTKAPRWKDCTKRTMRGMQYASGSLYVSKYFDKTSKNVALEMIDNIHDAFYEMVTENDWMDKATKAIALDKTKHMLKQIGYPDFILDDKKLDEYYDDLLIKDSDSYSQMMEKLSRRSIELGFKRLIKPVDRTEYNFSPAATPYTQVQVNVPGFPANLKPTEAVMSLGKNSMFIFSVFPAAILQAPLFHQTFPKALNYGGIGSIIGHEITHGLDDQGRQFDAVGNLREWWNDETKIKFEKRAQCIINQYGKIEVPEAGLKLNGKRTQGENIADNGGVKQAFRAYKNYLEKFGEEKRIEGLEQFDNEQMFFLGYARVRCGHRTVDSLINYILTNSHVPRKYRVNQVLANQPEFANAFKCDVGTPMNPTERCAVW